MSDTDAILRDPVTGLFGFRLEMGRDHRGIRMQARRSGFVTAKAQLFNATDGSAEVKTEAVLKAYHGQVVPMFCLVSARGFFLAALTATL